MQRIMLLAVVASTTISCSTPADNTPDTAAAAAAAPVDTKADEAAIVRADSAWIRNVVSKNVDSLMTYYTPDAVSYGFGGAPASGTDQIRANYTEMVKSTITDPTFTSQTVKISDDGKMAYDHGTYSMTIAPPGGKPAKENGAFLNVWRKVDGQWKLAAEMGTSVAPKQ